jgi:sterol desaturase/sphingolipid hydroxylase (fatty acid hydroxylase superfamily)
MKSIENFKLKNILSWMVLPVLLYGGTGVGYLMFYRWNMPLVYGILVVIAAFILIGLFERLLPYRKDWNLDHHGDTKVDVAFLLLQQSLTLLITRAWLLVIPLLLPSILKQGALGSIWPVSWPIILQLVIYIYTDDFIYYWLHRWGHKNPVLWRVHSIHHSPDRLYFNNAPRFHAIETIVREVCVMTTFYLLGVEVMLIELAQIYISIFGLLQHANISFKLGFQNYILSTADLHRWHHSKLIKESDNNFGGNVILWDMIFGTFYYPKGRQIGTVGIYNPAFPKSFLGQLMAPFSKRPLDKPEDYIGNEALYEEKIIRENKEAAQKLGINY